VTRAIAATQQLVNFCDAIRFDARMKGVLPAPFPEVHALPAGKRFPLFRMEKNDRMAALEGTSKVEAERCCRQSVR
jgi:hypothetical protein